MNKPIDETSFFQLDPNTPIVEVEDILKLIKYGKFHTRLIIFHMISYVTTALLGNNFAFYLMRPVYDCTYLDPINNTTSIISCKQNEFCLNPPPENLVSWEIDKDDQFALQNWF